VRIYAVLSNDRLNGVVPVVGTNPGNVTLTAISIPNGLTLNPNGTISASANTQAVLIMVYEIVN
jgi:hypothetical protein